MENHRLLSSQIQPPCSEIREDFGRGFTARGMALTVFLDRFNLPARQGRVDFQQNSFRSAQ
jgi:hypothetical protein